jgi:hypothetical protein
MNEDVTKVEEDTTGELPEDNLAEDVTKVEEDNYSVTRSVQFTDYTGVTHYSTREP